MSEQEEIIRSLSNPFTGLFSSWSPPEIRPYDPQVFAYSVTLPQWSARSYSIVVGGANFEERRAILACIGEGIERAQPYPLPDDIRITASYDEWPLSEPAIEPEQWVLFHSQQYARPDFPFAPLTRKTRCKWLCFRHAITGEPWWIPEEFAYLYTAFGESHHLAPSISTGLSCGCIGQSVLSRGLQEVIERDALMGAWWETYPLEEWEGKRVLAYFSPEIASKIHRANLQYRFYRIDSPYSSHVTMVTVAGIDKEGFCFSVGAGCRETRSKSFLKSLLEALHGRYYVRYLKTQLNIGSHGVANEIVDFPHHAVYYSLFPEKLPLTIFERARKNFSETDDVEENILVLTAQLGSQHPVLFRNMTPPGIAQQFPEWYVLKVVVPGLQPMHGHEQFPFLGGKLWEPKALAEWNSILPHPFP